jgi:hypothetical protein
MAAETNGPKSLLSSFDTALVLSELFLQPCSQLTSTQGVSVRYSIKY